MTRQARRHSEEVAFRNLFGQTFDAFTKTASVAALLAVGRRISASDYSVRFFYNKQHPQFSKNRDKLIRAVRRAWNEGAFDHRAQAIEILESDFSHLVQ